MFHSLYSVTNAQETSLLESNRYGNAGEKPEKSCKVYSNNLSRIEKWGSHVALSIVELRLAEGIS